MHNKSLLEPDVLGVLKKVQSIFYSESLVAGGYLRDRYFNKSYKDIDIFSLGRHIMGTGEFTRKIENKFPESLGLEDCSCEYTELTNQYYEVDSKLNFEFQGKKYEIIFVLTDPIKHLKLFDFSINNIFDFGSETITKGSFDTTAKSHHIKFVNNPKNLGINLIIKLEARLKYLLEKYPDFSLYEPHKEELEKVKSMYLTQHNKKHYFASNIWIEPPEPQEQQFDPEPHAR